MNKRYLLIIGIVIALMSFAWVAATHLLVRSIGYDYADSDADKDFRSLFGYERPPTIHIVRVSGHTFGQADILWIHLIDKQSVLPLSKIAAELDSDDQAIPVYHQRGNLTRLLVPTVEDILDQDAITVGWTGVCSNRSQYTFYDYSSMFCVGGSGTCASCIIAVGRNGDVYIYAQKA